MAYWWKGEMANRLGLSFSPDFYMKATLIIKNIENLYTCDKDFTVYHHAFIAMYHDKIIDLGIHDYKKYWEETTRVIDACGETVVPAFIDCQYKGFSHVRLGDQLRENNSALYAMRQNGILSLVTQTSNLQRKELTQDVFVKKTKSDLPILETEKDYLDSKPETFLVSCGFGKPNSYVYSFQHLAYILFNYHKVDSKTLIQSMTSLPAKEFDLNDRGSLEIGKLADVLVLQVPTIEHYFQTLGRNLIHRMIKNGIPFYPNWIRC